MPTPKSAPLINTSYQYYIAGEYGNSRLYYRFSETSYLLESGGIDLTQMGAEYRFRFEKAEKPTENDNDKIYRIYAYLDRNKDERLAQYTLYADGQGAFAKPAGALESTTFSNNEDLWHVEMNKYRFFIISNYAKYKNQTRRLEYNLSEEPGKYGVPSVGVTESNLRTTWILQRADTMSAKQAVVLLKELLPKADPTIFSRYNSDLAYGFVSDAIVQQQYKAITWPSPSGEEKYAFSTFDRAVALKAQMALWWGKKSEWASGLFFGVLTLGVTGTNKVIPYNWYIIPGRQKYCAVL